MTEGFDHATEVGASRSQSDGDDLRLVTDGFEQPRWIGENAATDANSAATNLWGNFNYGPRRTAVLLSAITAVLPGEGGDLEVWKGGTLGFPPSGALLIDDEVLIYSGVTESNASGNAAFTGIVRAQRSTTAAAHSASATIYWLEHRTGLVYGNTGVAAPDSRADLKPLLDLTSSTVSNLRHEWISFADSTYGGRSMQWLTRSRTTDDQYDKLLAPTASPVTALTWEYQSGGAVAGKPIGNTYYRDFPTGTGSSGGNVASLTRVLADTLGMWVDGIDDAGQTVNLQKFAGALTSASANITAPTNPVYRLECWAFNQVLARRPDGPNWLTSTQALSATGTDNAQRFLVGSEPISVVSVWLAITSITGGQTYTCTIYADDGSNAPVTGGSIASASVSSSTIVGSDAYFVFSTPVTLSPNTRFWLGFDDGGGSPLGYFAYIAYDRAKFNAAASITTQTWNFRVFGRPDALATALERCDTNSYADDGDQVTVDGVTVYLSSTDTPYVAMQARTSIYRFVGGVLYNDTTGQSMTVNAVCRVGDELRIDIGGGQALNIDDENGAPFSVDYSDSAGKFELAPGTNVLRFVETGLAGVNVAVDGYARWE